MSNTKLRQTGAQVQALLDKAGAQVLRDSTEHWNAALGFVPFDGQIIVYSDYKVVDGNEIPGIKIGSGNGYVQDLAFIGEDEAFRLFSHIENEERHINSVERLHWNRKLNVDDSAEVEDETLIFNRD